jgi:hypothetical protein
MVQNFPPKKIVIPRNEVFSYERRFESKTQCFPVHTIAMGSSKEKFLVPFIKCGK